MSALLAVWTWLCGGAALAEEPAPAWSPGTLAWHGQITVVDQLHTAFAAAFSGANSLDSKASGRETVDLTLMVGARLWKGAELWADPEIDQGFGLSNTLGVAGFPSGEAYKVGRSNPYLRLQRLFIRQTIDLGGPSQALDADQNQMPVATRRDRLVLTVGKFSVADVFDTNGYAHDTKHDFLNWGLIDTATFDYAADAWGYAYGAAGELYVRDWTLRTALFDLSRVPNGETLEIGFGQYQAIAEIERRWSASGRPGAARLTGFLTHGRMGRYDEALAQAARAGGAPATADVRRMRDRGGLSLNIEQQISGPLGVFLRVGLADGRSESYEFTDVDRTFAAGLSLGGAAWKRPDDRLGLGVEVNGVSRIHQAYLAAGGLGILVGDGALPHPASEAIIEGWYAITLRKGVSLSFDAQYVDNPAYNSDRGPVGVFAARLHAQF